jgi:hypothetical protein
MADSRQQIEGTGRKAGVVKQLRHPDGQHRRLLRGQHDHRIAGRQRTGTLLHRLDQRDIEGGDTGNDPQRLTDAEPHPPRRVRGEGLATNAPGDTRGGAQVADGVLDLEPSLHHRGTDLLDQHLFKGLGPLFQ